MYDARREFQVFPEEYFSGCDVTLYLGDFWIDEVQSLNFTLQEMTRPLFGYKSYTYDAVMRGSRIIQGTFVVNFTEPMYLHRIIKEASRKKQVDGNSYAFDRIAGKDAVLLSQGLSQAKFLALLKDKSVEEKQKLIAEKQQEVWKKDQENILADMPDPTFFLNRKKESFDIRILYGTTMDQVVKRVDLMQRFRLPSSAAYLLKNIQLGGLSQQIDPSGNPVVEVYSFIANDLVPIY